MNYIDLGYDGFLSKSIFPRRKTSSDVMSEYLTGSVGNSIISSNSVDNSKTKYQYRGYNAVVDIEGNSDYKEIQDAVDYVNEQGGGTILIKEGTYILGSDIILYSKIKLIGEGPGKTILNMNGSNQIKLTGDLNDLSNLVGFSVNAFQNVSISDLMIKNCTDSNGAIYLQYIRNALIENCFFQDNTLDAQLSVCFPGVIRDCTSYSSTSGFLLSGGRSKIEHSIVSVATQKGIELSGGGNSASVAALYNLVDGDCATGGIVTDGGQNVKIIGNHINDIDSSGIYLLATGTSPHAVIIDGNHITDGNNATYGIFLKACTYPIVSNNHIEPGYSKGIGLDVVENARIVNNGIRLAGAANSVGINIGANADRTLVDGNDIEDCATTISNSGSNTITGDNITA